ncbi:MAG TPA: hypothetical protein PLK77_06780 [Pyrinomonadaceae bacterium]|nr:hypothetical protein [Pyrinomonadaceae bacterium]
MSAIFGIANPNLNFSNPYIFVNIPSCASNSVVFVDRVGHIRKAGLLGPVGLSGLTKTLGLDDLADPAENVADNIAHAAPFLGN